MSPLDSAVQVAASTRAVRTRGLVFVLASGLCGLVALVLLPRAAPALLRVLVAAAAAVVVAPALGLLFVLQQRGRLEIDEA